MTIEQAAAARKTLWNTHCAKVRLDINDWAELAEALDGIIIDLGVKDLVYGDED